MSRLLVLDFDGTMTDAEAEGLPFRRGYLEDLALVCGLPLPEVERRAAEVESELADIAGEVGWLFEGRIVAPATVDPYLRMMPVARRLLDEAGRLLDETDRTRVLDGIFYKYNYQKTTIAFRPGAGEVLRSLSGTATYVVTNSHTDAVQLKIRSLGARPEGGNDLEWLAQRVTGRAQKYCVDEAFEAVAPHLQLPGLRRPILLRRRSYHDTLRRLLDEVGADWADLCVAGDIFELDLSLPLAMGARVALLTNAHTPAWERDFLSTHPRAALLPGLEGLRAWADLR